MRERERERVKAAILDGVTRVLSYLLTYFGFSGVRS